MAIRGTWQKEVRTGVPSSIRRPTVEEAVGKAGRPSILISPRWSFLGNNFRTCEGSQESYHLATLWSVWGTGLAKVPLCSGGRPLRKQGYCMAGVETAAAQNQGPLVNWPSSPLAFLPLWKLLGAPRVSRPPNSLWEVGKYMLWEGDIGLLAKLARCMLE